MPNEDQDKSESTVSLEDLDTALEGLLKSTGAEEVKTKLKEVMEPLAKGEPVAKGGQVYSGVQTPQGAQGGGGADFGDAGGLDDMMIGKMVEFGIPANLVAKFAAFYNEMDGEEEEGEID